MTDSFTMPILNTRFSITWKPTFEDRAQAKINHGGQSLEKLAERMGVDWCELEAILSNEPYTARVRIEDLSRQQVNTILRHRAGIQK